MARLPKTTTSVKGTMKSSSDDDVPWLLQTTLSSSFIYNNKSNNNNNTMEQQPFSLLIYKIGKIIYDECNNTKNDHGIIIKQVFNKFIFDIPETIMKNTLVEITESFLTLISTTTRLNEQKIIHYYNATTQQNTSKQDQQLMDALLSLCGLYSSSSVACQVLNYDNRNATDFYYALHQLYQNLHRRDQKHQQEAFTALQAILSNLLLVIIVQLIDKHQQQHQQEQWFLHLLVDLSTTTNTTYKDSSSSFLLLQDAIHSEIICYTSPNKTIRTLREGLEQLLHKISTSSFALQYIDDEQQYIYMLTALLEKDDGTAVADNHPSSIPNSWQKSKTQTTTATTRIKSTSKKANNNNNNNNGVTSASITTTKELYIHQIKQIMPHLGEGYIELALECYGWNVDTVLSKLLDTTTTKLHPRLQSCDIKLPRWSTTKEKDNMDNEAKNIQLKYLKAIQDQEERDAYIMTSLDNDNEYDDDYDDQYDDNVGVGDVSSGPTIDAINYEDIRRYNTLRRGGENEDTFWDDIRNENRPKKKVHQQTNSSSDYDDDDEQNDGNMTNNLNQKKWGPDKGKGGRVIGPDGKYIIGKKKMNVGTTMNDSSRAETTTTTVDQLTKIQKRRKNDNKAKVGNHHRKDRALKKSAGI